MKLRYLAMAAALLATAGCNSSLQDEDEQQQEEAKAEFEQTMADASLRHARDMAERETKDAERRANAASAAPAADLDNPAGATRPGCQSPGLLVGSWVSADGSMRYEFTASGRVTVEGRALGASSGQYCVIGPGRAQLQGDGGTSVMEYTLSADGNTFTSTNFLGEQVTHRRVR